LSRRSERRRKTRRESQATADIGVDSGRTTRIALIFLGLGLFVVAVVGIVVLATSGGDDGGPDDVAIGTTLPPGDTANPEDEEELLALAERSIEVLPAGQWPSLYTDFTAAFQASCTLADFTQAGVDGAAAQGVNLPLLEYVGVSGLTVNGDTASGTITGHYRGQEGTEYNVQAVFQREGGVWKISTAPDTTGCSAFNILGD
jgi:hypothetical protein